MFIIDSSNSLIVEDLSQKNILKLSLYIISNPVLDSDRFFYGGSSLTAEYGTVDAYNSSNPEEGVRFSLAALNVKGWKKAIASQRSTLNSTRLTRDSLQEALECSARSEAIANVLYFQNNKFLNNKTGGN